jgi:hypothetical protein
VADYLRQLVQRVRQPDDAIQPRLSSRFEPPWHAKVEAPTLAMPIGRESPQWSEPAETSIDSSTELPGFRDDREGRVRRGRLAGALSVDAGSSVDQQPTEEPAASHVEPRRKGTRPPRRRDPEGPPSVDVPVPAQNPRAAHVTETVSARREVESRVVVRAAPVPGPLVAPIQRAPQIEQPANRIANRRSPDNPALPEAIAKEVHRRGAERRPETTLEPRQIVKVVPNVGLEALRPSAARATELPDAERSAGPDAPVIQVTIGRVEIRASVAAPVTRKPQARPPAMSLEEYLKQRKGAARE